MGHCVCECVIACVCARCCVCGILCVRMFAGACVRSVCRSVVYMCSFLCGGPLLACVREGFMCMGHFVCVLVCACLRINLCDVWLGQYGVCVC